MNRERYNALMRDENMPLTQDEILTGWHFCYEFDGLLVGPGMSELNHCRCLPKDHPAYKTVSSSEEKQLLYQLADKAFAPKNLLPKKPT